MKGLKGKSTFVHKILYLSRLDTLSKKKQTLDQMITSLVPFLSFLGTVFLYCICASFCVSLFTILVIYTFKRFLKPNYTSLAGFLLFIGSDILYRCIILYHRFPCRTMGSPCDLMSYAKHQGHLGRHPSIIESSLLCTVLDRHDELISKLYWYTLL